MSTLVYYLGVGILGAFVLAALGSAVLMLRNYTRQRAIRRLIGLRRAP